MTSHKFYPKSTHPLLSHKNGPRQKWLFCYTSMPNDTKVFYVKKLLSNFQHASLTIFKFWVLGEISILDEASMSIIAFPPTPQKTPTVNKEGEGISSQILPLSRLSMSGSNCSTSPVLSEADQRNSYSSPPPGKYDLSLWHALLLCTSWLEWSNTLLWAHSDSW